MKLRQDGTRGYVIKDVDDGKVFYVTPIKDIYKPILRYIPKGYSVQVQHEDGGCIIQILVKIGRAHV